LALDMVGACHGTRRLKDHFNDTITRTHPALERNKP